jgi:outer membrane protein OmpA-like peptidoglycan-associated protein
MAWKKESNRFMTTYRLLNFLSVGSMSFLLSLTLGTIPLLAQGQDARGSSDHPVLSRYPGSRIQTYNRVDFDQYALALGVENNHPSNIQRIEGKVTKIGYVNPAGRSSFEIYSNYEEALKSAGFEALWSCEGTTCGQAMYWSPVNGLTASGGPREIRYLAVRGKVNDQIVTIAMAVNTTGTTVHIIESKAMDAGLVTASAAELATGIERDGHISIYNIYFDVGKADLKPESKAALDEVARLLTDRPTLRLMVVGHTDSTGDLNMNIKLSSDRAAAVVKALTTTYTISTSRLSPHGAGPIAPVASNRTDEGRAKNRRVDLVEQ